MSMLFKQLIHAAETCWLPDLAVRAGIRQIVRQRFRELEATSCEQELAQLHEFMTVCSQSPLAVAPVESNQQHYEVPTEFFQNVLGPRMKYSSCFWGPETQTLSEAEDISLALTCDHAQLADGMNILELGCGWGSLTLWMAERFPHAQITSISHSASQRKYITSRAEAAGFHNVKVVTSDINLFTTDQKFDRVVSVEMFEHVRNHQELFRRISSWLNDEGKLFTHVFCHRRQAYLYESRGPGDWMTDYFFTGGVMPSDGLFARYQRDLRLDQQWRWNGQHYQRTSNTWLENMDKHREAILPLMDQVYGSSQARRWFQRWRMFFMACAEMFGFHRGNAWFVSHYLFSRQQVTNAMFSLPMPATVGQMPVLNHSAIS